MFFSDPLYLFLTIVGGLLVFIPQLLVRQTVERYHDVAAEVGVSGGQVAESILRDHGIDNIEIEVIDGFLTDHYDPIGKKIRLSNEIYFGQSVTALSIAAHEAGHALQHAQDYKPVIIRSLMAPVVNLVSGFGPWMIIISLALGTLGHVMPAAAMLMAWIGVLFYSLAVLFHAVTLPVEFDASARALRILSNEQFLNGHELAGAKKVLNAAAMTYVATALYALVELLYFVFRILGDRR